MVALVDKKIDAIFNELLGSLQSTKKNRFIMEWRGSKIPRGAKLGGQNIAWIQHGYIYGEYPDGRHGDELGFYNRLAEFADGDFHKIEIFTDQDECIDPSGKKLDAQDNETNQNH